MAEHEESLRVDIEMLERMAARVEARGGPRNERLSRAIVMVIVERQRQLERSELAGRNRLRPVP